MVTEHGLSSLAYSSKVCTLFLKNLNIFNSPGLPGRNMIL